MATEDAAGLPVDDDYEEYVPVKKRRIMEQEKLLAAKAKIRGVASRRPGAGEGGDDQANGSYEADGTEALGGPEARPTLLVKAMQLKKEQPEMSKTEQLIQEEKEMLERLSERKTLMSVKELAKGIHVSFIPSNFSTICCFVCVARITIFILLQLCMEPSIVFPVHSDIRPAVLSFGFLYKENRYRNRLLLT